MARREGWKRGRVEEGKEGCRNQVFVKTRFRHDLEIAPLGVRFRHVRPNLRVAEVEFIRGNASKYST